jgi:hypothetical protein
VSSEIQQLREQLQQHQVELRQQREIVLALQTIWSSLPPRSPLVQTSPIHKKRAMISADGASIFWFGRSFPLRRGLQRSVIVDVLWPLHVINPQLVIDDYEIGRRAGAAEGNFRLARVFPPRTGIIGWMIHRIGHGYKLAPPPRRIALRMPRECHSGKLRCAR